ncbi:MAG: phosphoribosylanthranilate isomerase [Lysobacterales bacterium CG02_land_8_20_14_3_00_62_12]|nr:MAG: phosphoribosylanthranilate isomerase [Xanthomonadales bacterium CG02_land_8_20_14_3_00_62_12]
MPEPGFERTRIKFCGITRSVDAAAAVACGADAIGLVFVPGSGRAVTAEQAAEIARSVAPFVARVGLFRNAEAATVRAVLARVELDYLQFHGEESAEFCAQFARPWLKAVPMAKPIPPPALAEFLAEYAAASGWVFDSHDAGGSGGSGQTFDWSPIPRNLGTRLILAGGLHVGNVAAALAAVHPYAVDLSSGVESAPGVKDHAKMRAFVHEVRRAERH